VELPDWAGPPPTRQFILQVLRHRVIGFLEQVFIKSEQEMARDQIDDMARTAEATLLRVKLEVLGDTAHCSIVIRSIVQNEVASLLWIPKSSITLMT
jgi:hypothetical protein